MVWNLFGYFPRKVYIPETLAILERANCAPQYHRKLRKVNMMARMLILVAQIIDASIQKLFPTFDQPCPHPKHPAPQKPPFLEVSATIPLG
jgi:hypothetical protein